jgi:uncharacterized membrane protein YidH (DUF202 family)
MSPDRRSTVGRSIARPATVFDPGLQHERTALAWERTAIAGMVAGVLLARYTAASLPPFLAVFGVTQVVLGSCVLVWSARHYDDLHGPLRAGQSPVHPGAARLVGIGTLVFTAVATAIAVVIALS